MNVDIVLCHRVVSGSHISRQCVNKAVERIRSRIGSSAQPTRSQTRSPHRNSEDIRYPQRLENSSRNSVGQSFTLTRTTHNLQLQSLQLQKQQTQPFQNSLSARSSIQRSPQPKTTEYTHFINLPINAESFKNQFNNFKSHVLRESDTYNVTGNMFSYPSRLHLTLFLLSLDTPEKLDRCRFIIEKSQVSTTLLEKIEFTQLMLIED